MGSSSVIPPPPDGSGIVEVNAQSVAGIPPPPDGSGVVPVQADAQQPQGGFMAGAKAFVEETPLKAVGDVVADPGGAARGLLGALKDPTGTAIAALKNLLVDAPGAVMQKSADAFGRGDYSGALAHAAYSVIPALGPSLDEAGDELRGGEYAKGVGRTLGVASNIVAPEAIKAARVPQRLGDAMRGTAKGLYKSAVKPTGKAWGRIDKAMDAGLREGLSPNEAGVAGLKSGVRESGRQIGDAIDAAPDVPSVKAAPVEKAIAELREGFLPSERAALDSAAEDFFGQLRQEDGSLRDMTPKEAHTLKVNLQDAVVRAKKGAYSSGAMNSAGVEAWQTAASGLGEQLVEQFPEIGSANARYSSLKALEPILEDAKNRIAKREPFGLISSIGGVGGAAAGGLTGGLTGLVVTKILSDPILRTKAAVALSRASGGAVSNLAAAARLQSYATALERGAEATPSRRLVHSDSFASDDSPYGDSEQIARNNESDVPMTVFGQRRKYNR